MHEEEKKIVNKVVRMCVHSHLSPMTNCQIIHIVVYHV